MQILLVDSDRQNLDATASGLRDERLAVLEASNGGQALTHWRQSRPDIIVLQLEVRAPNGFEVLRQIRSTDSVPVLAVSSGSDPDSAARAFALGVDGYVTQPVGHRELAGRIRALYRRAANAAPASSRAAVVAGRLRLETESGEVLLGDRPVAVTPTEFRILEILATNDGQVVSLDRILAYALADNGGTVSSLRAHVSHLRTKLRAGAGCRIVAVPGAGYRLEPPR